MAIFIATLSIFVITAFILILNKILPFRICPICAGVSGTWLWMLGGMFFGLLPTFNFQLPTAILMGGSIVGIAYQIEKRLPGNRPPLLWKTLFISAGFVAVYSVLAQWWVAFVAILFLLLLLLFFFMFSRDKSFADKKTIEKLEESMKECC